MTTAKLLREVKRMQAEAKEAGLPEWAQEVADKHRWKAERKLEGAGIPDRYKEGAKERGRQELHFAWDLLHTFLWKKRISA